MLKFPEKGDWHMSLTQWTPEKGDQEDLIKEREYFGKWGQHVQGTCDVCEGERGEDNQE